MPTFMNPPKVYDSFLPILSRLTILEYILHRFLWRLPIDINNMGQILYVSSSNHIIVNDIDMVTLYYNRSWWTIEALQKFNMNMS